MTDILEETLTSHRLRSSGRVVGFLLAMALMALACSFQAVPEATTEGRTTQMPSEATPIAGADAGDSALYTLVPYGYSLEPVGDGWNEGKVFLAFENATSTFIEMAGPMEFPNGIVVETQEGVTYDAHVSEISLGFWYPDRPVKATEFQLVPPGFRFSRYLHSSGASITHGVTWKSATAATPKRIRFNDFPDLSFELPSLGTPILFPFDSPPIEIMQLMQMEGVSLGSVEGVIEARFTGRCGNDSYFGKASWVDPNSLYLELTVENHDAFNAQYLPLRLRVSAFYSHPQHDWADGLLWMGGGHFTFAPGEWGQDDLGFELGPAQTKLGYALISGRLQGSTVRPPFIVLFGIGEDGYVVFDGNECVIAQ